jgi:predicted DNA-binding protein (MmcQ/YjbR family)
MKLTGAAILVSRGTKVLQAAPAVYPYRSTSEGAQVASADDLTPDPLLVRVRSACLALPGVAESVAWDNPVFRVAGRPFAGFGMVVPWGPALRLRVGPARQQAMLRDFRFFPTPRFIHRGWVSLKLAGVTDWQAVGELVRATYEVVAPKRLRQELRPAEPADGGRHYGFGRHFVVAAGPASELERSAGNK